MGDDRSIRVVSALGGGERRLGSFRPRRERPAWSPDGRFIAASTAEPGGIHLIPVQGGEPRFLTRPVEDAADRAPAFSPDGGRLAYAACTGRQGDWSLPTCDIHVLALDSDLRGEGRPQRLTHLNTTILSTAWSADGRWILFETMPYVFAFYLWRVPADGRSAPQRVEAAGLWARAPATARASDLVVFTRSVRRIELRRFQRGGTTQALSLSSFSDLDGSYSPDGTRIALASGRSGQSLDIWVSALDGSGAVRLTQGLGRHAGGPRWSLDGRRLAFDVLAADGQWDVWLVDVDGGSPVRLTDDPSDENISGWSRDGKWVYFWTGRNGQSNIWRMPASGGRQEQITTGGAGINSCESVDGRILFYSAALTDAPLLALPLTGGPPRRVQACVREGGFRVTRQGLYYVGCGPTASPPLHFVDGGTGRDTVLGVLERAGGGALWHLSVSPDDREVLYSGIVDPGADLMLIRNLR